MPYALQIDEDHRCVFIKWRGVFSVAEIQAFRNETAGNTSFRRCSRRFHDLRDVDLNVPTSEVQRIANVATPPDARQIAYIGAILVASDVDFGIMRMFVTLYKSPIRVLNVFRVHDEAKAWLGLPQDHPDIFRDMAGPE
jgi:hypothetical protein